jgi:hypothetical protein
LVFNIFYSCFGKMSWKRFQAKYEVDFLFLRAEQLAAIWHKAPVASCANGNFFLWDTTKHGWYGRYPIRQWGVPKSMKHEGQCHIELFLEPGRCKEGPCRTKWPLVSRWEDLKKSTAQQTSLTTSFTLFSIYLLH